MLRDVAEVGQSLGEGESGDGGGGFPVRQCPASVACRWTELSADTNRVFLKLVLV